MTNTNKTSRRDAEFTQKKSFNLTQISQISQKAMRHDYPHAEAQRALSSHRDFIGPLPRSAPHPNLQARCLARLPTPLRGRVLARGAGCIDDNSS